MPTANTVLLESIAPLKTELAVLQERTVNFQEQIDSLKKQIEKIDVSTITERLAVAEDRVTELKRLKEESEKRHWQFVYIFAGAVATLLVTVIVQLVIAWVKK